MNHSLLQEFIDRISNAGIVTLDDVRLLQRDLLPDGIQCEQEADLLIALDRKVRPQTDRWEEFLVSSVVEFVVWNARPTGRIDTAKAGWLVASLSAGNGPTRRGCRIAFEVVREADSVCETLAAYAMRVGRDHDRQRGENRLRA